MYCCEVLTPRALGKLWQTWPAVAAGFMFFLTWLKTTLACHKRMILLYHTKTPLLALLRRSCFKFYQGPSPFRLALGKNNINAY